MYIVQSLTEYVMTEMNSMSRHVQLQGLTVGMEIFQSNLSVFKDVFDVFVDFFVSPVSLLLFGV